MALAHRDTCRLGAQPHGRIDKLAILPDAENLARLGLDLLFFASDEGDDIIEQVERGDTGIARARGCLKRRHQDLLYSKARERRQGKRQANGRAVGIGHERARPLA